MADLLKWEKLHLINAEEISFEGKEGDSITKWKYTFLTPEGKVQVGYLDSAFLKDFVDPSGIYEEKSAKLFAWKGRVWDNVMKFTLSPLDPKKVS